MARLSAVRALVGLLLFGSGALAQQGLIVEPWRQPSPALRVLASAERRQPDAGLGPAPAALAASPPQPASVPAAPSVSKWLPPVVTLLVNPWPRDLVLPPAARTRWVPSSVDIVDPWAQRAVARPPRPASPPAGGDHSTIF